jgi:hypothetical protein
MLCTRGAARAWLSAVCVLMSACFLPACLLQVPIEEQPSAASKAGRLLKRLSRQRLSLSQEPKPAAVELTAGSRDTSNGEAALPAGCPDVALAPERAAVLQVSASLPFQQVTLVFKDIRYWVPNPAAAEAKGKKVAGGLLVLAPVQNAAMCFRHWQRESDARGCLWCCQRSHAVMLMLVEYLTQHAGQVLVQPACHSVRPTVVRSKVEKAKLNTAAAPPAMACHHIICCPATCLQTAARRCPPSWSCSRASLATQSPAR